jgi:hypothetical protein
MARSLTSSLFKRLLKPDYEQLVATVEQLLRNEGWKVQHRPIYAGCRPDIIASQPSEAYAIVVKQGKWIAGLGAVAQAEAFRNVVTAETGKKTKGMLIVSGDVPEELNSVAESADVMLVRVGRGSPLFIRDALASSGVLSVRA